jgi:hypothetical protein
MSNHARGLWGYGGPAADGEPLTIQSTGVGGPSTAAVLREVAGLGVRSAVLLGTARAVAGGPAPGTLLTVGRALGRDGTSRALGAPDAAAAPHLAGAAVVATGDLAWAPPAGEAGGWAAWDLACAPALALAVRLGVDLGAILLVTGGEDLAELDPDAVEAGMEEAGRRGAALLGVPDRSPAGAA